MLLLIGGLDIFLKGGWAMYPLLLLSIVSVYLILERALYFMRQLPRISRDIADVLRGMPLLPERLSGELAPALSRSLKQGSLDEPGLEAAVGREMQEAARGVSVLETISQIGPMFGLLGTVSGMIDVFFRVAEVDGGINVRVLANGISEALVATWSGLAVAIPAFIAYRAFRGRLLSLENTLYGHIDDARRLIQRGPSAPRSGEAEAEHAAQARSEASRSAR